MAQSRESTSSEQSRSGGSGSSASGSSGSGALSGSEGTSSSGGMSGGTSLSGQGTEIIGQAQEQAMKLAMVGALEKYLTLDGQCLHAAQPLVGL